MRPGLHNYLLQTNARVNTIATASESFVCESQAERSSTTSTRQETEALAALPHTNCKRCYHLCECTGSLRFHYRSGGSEENGEGQGHSESFLRCTREFGQGRDRVSHESYFKPDKAFRKVHCVLKRDKK